MSKTLKSAAPFVALLILFAAISAVVSQSNQPLNAQVRPDDVRAASRYSSYKSLTVTTTEQFIVLGTTNPMSRRSYPDTWNLQCSAEVIVRALRDGAVTGTPETPVTHYGGTPAGSQMYHPATTYTGYAPYSRFRALENVIVPFSMRMIALPTGAISTRNAGFGLATASGTATCDSTVYWGEN